MPLLLIINILRFLINRKVLQKNNFLHFFCRKVCVYQKKALPLQPFSDRYKFFVFWYDFLNLPKNTILP